MKSSKTCVLSFIALFVMNSAAFGHVEAEFFLPQVPDPSAMMIDGDEGDWDWLDRSFAMGPENFYDASGNDGYTKEDFDFALFMAWSQPPDNRQIAPRSIPRVTRQANHWVNSWVAPSVNPLG